MTDRALVASISVCCVLAFHPFAAASGGGAPPSTLPASAPTTARTSDLASVQGWFESDEPGLLDSTVVARLEKWVSEHATDAEAAYWLARVYENNLLASDRQEEAVALLAKSASLKFPPAMSALAARYYEGYGVKADLQRARALTEEARAKGDARAFHQLAMSYWRGAGLEKNERKAVECFKKAARLGCAESIYAISALHRKGLLGFEKNASQSFLLMRKAAKRGYPPAQYAVAAFYQKGYGIQEDLKAAFAWAQKGANRGDANAMCLLSGMYTDGEGTKRDPKKAVVWSRRAADRGSSEGMHRLADAYLFGRGVARDRLQGIVWLRRAAYNGSSNGQFRYAQQLLLGLSVPRNVLLGTKNFAIAAESGHSEAQEMVSMEKGESALLEHVRQFIVGIVASDAGGKIRKRTLGLIVRPGQILVDGRDGLNGAAKAVATTYDGRKIEITGISADDPDSGLLLLSANITPGNGVSPRFATWYPMAKDCFDVVGGPNRPFAMARYAVVIDSDFQYIPGLGRSTSVRSVGRDIQGPGVVVSNLGVIVALRLDRKVDGKMAEFLVPAAQLAAMRPQKPVSFAEWNKRRVADNAGATLKRRFDGISLLCGGRPKEAMAKFEAIYRSNPEDVKSLVWTGVCKYNLADYGRAIATYRKAMDLGAPSSDVLCAIAEAQYAAGRRQQAIQTVRKVIDISPDHIRAHEMLAGISGDAGDFKTAEAACKKVLNLDTGRVQLRILLGLMYAMQKRSSEAIAEYEKAIELRPDIVKSYMLLAMAYVRLGRYQEGFWACEQGLASPSMIAKSDLRVLYGACAVKTNQVSIALKQYFILRRSGRTKDADRLQKIIQGKARSQPSSGNLGTLPGETWGRYPYFR